MKHIDLRLHDLSEVITHICEPEWPLDFDSIPKVNENYWRLSRKHMTWDNNNSLPAIIVAMWRGFLTSDDWINHENQSWDSLLLIAVLGIVPLVLIKAIVTIIELIVDRLIISSEEIVLYMLSLFCYSRESSILDIDGIKKGEKCRCSISFGGPNWSP